MSGICGLVHWDDAPVAHEDLRVMAEAAAYRGSDGIRYRIDGHVGIANLATNVTPESLLEEQPLASPDRLLLLTADARIDNRADLIDVLGAENLLASDPPTDADLILAAYRRWGLDCPGHLLGDFAFAIWDSSKQSLFAARDPMGIRGFCYRSEPRRFLFATEVQQILAAPNVPARLFEPAVAMHLCGPFGRPEWSFYDGIHQLAPGHALFARSSGVQTWRFWDTDPAYRIEYSDERDYAVHFRELFQQAVRCRIRSPKPVGIWLSGGTDSGSVASMAGWLLQNETQLCPDFRAYCWAFEDLAGCDERDISSQILRHYHLEGTDVPADRYWPMQEFPATKPDRDEPPPIVYRALTDQTLKMAREEGRRILLLAERGDEISDAPYDHLTLLGTGQWQVLAEELEAQRRLTGQSWMNAAKALLYRPLLADLWSIGRLPRLRRLVRRLRDRPENPLTLPPWVHPEFAQRLGLKDLILEEFTRRAPEGFDVARALHHSVIFSPISIRRLQWEERCHARFGISFADPWSDRRITEFALAVPQWVISRVGENKRMARQAMQGITPEAVRKATRKTNPRTHYDLGFRDRARDTILGLITSSEAAKLGYVDPKALLECYQSYCSGHSSPYDFWWPLSLDMWLRIH